MHSKLNFFILAMLSICFFLGVNFVNAEASPTPTSENIQEETRKNSKIYVATVFDANELSEFSKEDSANNQIVTLDIEVQTSSGIRQDRREVVFTFPNEQFKKPLKKGDQVLIESTADFGANAPINFISYYRQYNVIIWAVILLGLFLTVSGFKNNLKYLQVLGIFIVSSLIVLFFYRRNTYLTFSFLFIWQIIATFVFSYRIFTKRIPSLILTFSVFGSQIIAMILSFVMNSINIFDTGLFDVLFPTKSDAREVMIYVFAVLVTFPISVIFAEQVLTESIKKKREDNTITKMELMKYLAKINLKSLNHIYLTFFGLFGAIFISTLALASNESIMFQAVNSSSLTQILSVGFLILFNILIFIPIVSAVTGIILGRVETHELVTDRNLRQLEL